MNQWRQSITFKFKPNYTVEVWENANLRQKAGHLVYIHVQQT